MIVDASKNGGSFYKLLNLKTGKMIEDVVWADDEKGIYRVVCDYGGEHEFRNPNIRLIPPRLKEPA